MHPPRRASCSTKFACLLIAGATLSSPAVASGDEAPTERVEVTSLRSPGAIEYKVAYRLLRAVAQTGEPPRVVAHVRVIGATDHLPIPSLKLRLIGPNTDQPVPVSPQGDVSIPLDEAAFNEGAEIVSNKKKGALGVSITLQPQFLTLPVRYRDLVTTIRAARKVRDELLPWYLRLILPTANAIEVCFPGAGQTVTLRAATEISRSADHIDTKDGVALHCARLGVNENEIDADAEIISPSGVTYRFGG